MRSAALALALCVFIPIASGAQTGAANSPAPAPAAATATPSLPVKRVVLYKTGVGYFEHLGTVTNRQDVTIAFTSSQLNDVLKSLTVIDLGKGRIASVNYNSAAPLDRRIGALRLPLDQRASSVEMLRTLRGARVEVSSDGGNAQGRLLSVERQTRGRGDEARTVTEFSIVTDSGELRTFELTPAVRIRVTERELRQEIGRYLDLVGSIREQDVRSMTISSVGSGERPLFVSYISEVPIWKSTYRLVLPSKGSKPLLQGWAIVDNTTGTDWTSVELSLVAGAPQSFIQEISQPYYGQRPVVPLPSNILLTPQTHQGTLEDESLAEGETKPEIGSLGETVTVQAEAPTVQMSMSDIGRGMAYERARDMTPAAAAGDMGDLFEYRIVEPVTLTKNQSALVPIINAEIDAERVSLWNRSSGSGRPLRAVWLTNASGLTLDGGSMAIVDGNAFAGEGLIDSLKPGERRLVSYASDLAVLVGVRSAGAPTRISRVRVRDGILMQDSEERATWTYTVRNEDAASRTVVIEHPTRDGWKLDAGQTPAEATPEAQRFRLSVDSKREGSLVVRDTRTGETRVMLTEMTDAIVTEIGGRGISLEALQKALKPLLDKKAEVAGLERQIRDVGGVRQAITQDQQRLRENMKALRGSPEEKQLLQRYTRQLDQQEDQLAELGAALGAAATKLEVARAELAKLVASLSFDINADR
jgi:hypothetical protein